MENSVGEKLYSNRFDISLEESPKKSKRTAARSTVQKAGRERKTSGLNRQTQILFSDSEDRIAALRITIAAGFLCSFGLSWRLWVASRLFPLAPVSDYLPAVRFPLDYVWFLSLLGLSLAILIIARPRKLILIFLFLAGLLALWDQNRWQPWFYQYFFLLAALGLYAWKEPGPKNRLAALAVCRLILVSTYFWSGLQKLNANFVRETWPDIASGVLGHLPEVAKNLPPFVILLIPLLEISIGLGLLSRRYRRLSVVFAIGTHLFVLILLVSSRENLVVWPWNIAMMVFVLVLFWQDDAIDPRQVLVVKNGFHALVLLLFGILPALSFFSLWDSYLSSGLYSGNTDQAVIYVSRPIIDRLPVSIHEHIWQSSEPFFLDINRWSYGELNVPLYPEPRVYRRVAERVCSYVGSSSDVRLRIKEKPAPLTAVRKSEYYDCDHLSSTDE